MNLGHRHKTKIADGMNKKEWQRFYGFDDEDMARIEMILNIFNGKIISVSVQPWQGGPPKDWKEEVVK